MSGVLITRPEPGAAETAAALATLGWEPVLAPALVLRSRQLAPVMVQASLITSRAAAAALPLGPPVLAVGEASAAEARALGHKATAAEGDAAALLALVRARLRPADGPLLLAVGEGYAQDLASGLRAAGFRVLRRIAYGAEPAATLPAAAIAAFDEGRISHALFFSPRSAERCIALLRSEGLDIASVAIRAIALSPRVAQVLDELPWRFVATAVRPDHASMLECLGSRIGH